MAELDLEFDFDDGKQEEEPEEEVLTPAAPINLPDIPDNAVLQAIAEQQDGGGIATRSRGYHFGSSFIVTSEDAVILKASNTWANSVKPDWEKVGEGSRLYLLCKYALENPSDEPITLGDIVGSYGAKAWENVLEESQQSTSWRELVSGYEKDEGAVKSLLAAKAQINLKSGGATNANSHSVRLKVELSRLFPEYYLCFVCASRVNACTRMIQGQKFEVNSKEVTYIVGEINAWEIVNDPMYGMHTPGIHSMVELNARRHNGFRAQAVRYVINRLCILKDALEDDGLPQSMFSPIAQTLRSYFPLEEVDTGLDANGIGYGSFADKGAMLALMLASCELEIIRSCASLVKTMIAQMPGINGMEQKLISVASVMMGYTIERALADPTAEEFASMVYSRISTTNLGSLAAVWLATNARFTYAQLLTAGLPETQALNAYSRVCPFIQAVLMHSAVQNGGYDEFAVITCGHVQEVFSNYALLLVQTTPGHTEVGASKMISEVEQQLVTTLFYGALSSESWLASRESTYLSQLLYEDSGFQVVGDAPVVDLGAGQLPV